MNEQPINDIEKETIYQKNVTFYFDFEEKNTLDVVEDKLPESSIIWEDKEVFSTETKVSVFDVAAYIISKKGAMTTMKLHKLLYYCQAWSLVWDEAPLFPERIEAWANGPVVKDLFSYHRGLYNIEKISIGNPNLLGKTRQETIDSVLNYYGDKPSQWLIDLTHLEQPWKDARKGMAPTERGSNLISLSSMAEYYSSL